MRIPVLCLTAFLMVSGFCFSDTIHVPGDQPTIQAGIDAAIEDDVVLVAPGTYVENISFRGKKIHVTSEQGAEATVIDGNRSGRVVSFVSGEESGTYLSGFTITNGYSNGDGGGVLFKDSCAMIYDNIICLNECAGNGAGIAGIQNADATIAGSVIRQNKTVSGGGGGIFSDHSDLSISSNIITDNECGFWLDGKTPPSRLHARDNNIERGARTEGEGGGVCMINNSSGDVTGNIISNNLAYRGAGICCNNFGGYSEYIAGNKIIDNICDESGAGIDCTDCPSLYIQSNFIARNEITLGGLGAGIHCYNSTPKITNNVICRNVNGSQPYYGGYGGGITFNHSSPQSDFTNNTIFDNYVDGVGGGIACYYDSFPVLSNSILWGNRTDSGNYGNAIYVGMNYTPAGITLYNCNVEGGLASVYVTSHGQLNWGNGMIDADPLFVNPDADDFHLTYPSPCLDAGDEASTSVPHYDFEGNFRTWYDTVDMGADEFFPHLYCTGDFTPGGLIDINFIGRPYTNRVALFVSLELRVSGLFTPWGIFWMPPSFLLINPVGPIPAEGVLALPEKIPITMAAPYDVFMQALIKDRLTDYYRLEVR